MAIEIVLHQINIIISHSYNPLPFALLHTFKHLFELFQVQLLSLHPFAKDRLIDCCATLLADNLVALLMRYCRITVDNYLLCFDANNVISLFIQINSLTAHCAQRRHLFCVRDHFFVASYSHIVLM